MKKKIITALTAMALVFTLAGCSVTVNGPAAGQTEGEKTKAVKSYPLMLLYGLFDKLIKGIGKVLSLLKLKYGIVEILVEPPVVSDKQLRVMVFPVVHRISPELSRG